MAKMITHLTEQYQQEGLKLNNKVVTAEELSHVFNNLKPNERLVETSDHNFHVVERIRG